MDEEIEDNVEELLNQLEESNQELQDLANTEADEDIFLTDDELDQFIINKTANLVNRTSQMLIRLSRFLVAAPDAETIEAYSKLLNSNNSLLDTMNKLNIQKRKEKASMKEKQLAIASKVAKEIEDSQEEEGKMGIRCTREEFFKMIKDKAIDIDGEEPKQIK